MLMPTSSEFVALCRAQVALLAQGFGASLSVVYLTEELREGAEAKLIPVVAYPETTGFWDEEHFLTLLPSESGEVGQSPRLLLADATSAVSMSQTVTLEPLWDYETNSDEATFVPQPQQMVLPLVHDGVVMGLLVTERQDRAWTEQEQTQIERVAHTLAIACLLDQRGQWLEHERHQQRLLQSQQRHIFDNLLHQFRNPLTALRTFGKLLMRRLGTSDPNREVAASIVRESDRLQDLLQQFDQAIDLGQAEWAPFALQPGPETPDLSVNAQPATGESAPESESWTTRPAMPLLPGSGFLSGANLTLEPCDVSAILTPLVLSAQAIAQERRLQFHAQIPASLPLVKVEAKALREVFSNLIDNALKYTPVGGQVYVQAGAERSAVTSEGRLPQLGIVIWDTGPGIPAQDLKHIFERHYRGVQANTEIPGTGLGLAIARGLIHQMQGEIQVFSPAQDSDLVQRPSTLSRSGPGTAFVVWLPLASG